MFDGAAVAQGDRVYGIGAFFPDGGRLSRQEKRELLAALNTVRALGRSRVAGTDNFYFFTPTNRTVMFAPDRADRLAFYRETITISKVVIRRDKQVNSRPFLYRFFYTTRWNL